MEVGYNKVPWTTRTELYDKFFINYGKIETRPVSFRQAAIDSATEISKRCKKINKIPLILYSGSIDSELIVAAFITAEVEFVVGHMKYMPYYNQHETQYVHKFCGNYKLQLQEFEVDAIKYLQTAQTMLDAAADNARQIELQFITTMTDTIKNKYYPVSNHPGVMLYRGDADLNEPSKWYWKDYEHLASFYFHCMRKQLEACPSFFHWSPEIILAFLLDPLIDDLVSNRIYGKISIRTSTLPLYLNAFPEFNFETRPKYRGFEYMSKHLINEINKKLNAKTFYDRHSGQTYEYNELVNLLI